MTSVTDNTSIERLKRKCAGVAAGSKMLVGEPAEACRAFASKATDAAKVVIRADTRFSGSASLANRFVISKGTYITPHRSRLIKEQRLEGQAKKRVRSPTLQQKRWHRRQSPGKDISTLHSFPRKISTLRANQVSNPTSHPFRSSGSRPRAKTRSNSSCPYSSLASSPGTE